MWQTGEMKAFLTYGLFPVHFFGALVAAHFAFVAGYSAPVILGVISAITAATLLWVERVHPAHRNWNVSQKDVGTDALHALVSMILLPKLLEILLASALGLAVVSLTALPCSLAALCLGYKVLASFKLICKIHYFLVKLLNLNN